IPFSVPPVAAYQTTAAIATANGQGERRNRIAPDELEIFQPHFDRDLHSAFELLSIPLYGNAPLDLSYPIGNPLPTAGIKWSSENHGSTVRNLAEKVTDDPAIPTNVD